MAPSLELIPLYKRTLGSPTLNNQESREHLRVNFLGFRDRVAQLVSRIGSELPNLTVHDVTHLDALWRVADQIAGHDYELNPAEAFVFGGAILLHDAAHVVAAYQGGVPAIKETIYWKDLIAQRYEGTEPPSGSVLEREALFQALRHLHAEQARNLPHLSWSIPGGSTREFLIENLELRQHYGDLIGEIASSHHWPPHVVVEKFRDRKVTPPSRFPTDWTVDALKIAFLLRTADAAHLDDQRAPWFLFALHQPTGISQDHWRFQAKLGQPKASDKGELIVTGSPFAINERQAWWLAFDTASMIGEELRVAHLLMLEEGRVPFAVSAVQGVENPESFSRYVPTAGWRPVGIAPRIGDVPRIIELLGGSKLYGDDPSLAIRELLQNAIDAVRALRAIGGLGPQEGRVAIRLTRCDEKNFWMSIIDTGVGMSRGVLTTVLLDFGQSLWRSDRLRDEWPGLASAGFEAVGQFGIGFFSVFMLGTEVVVGTRRHSRHADDDSEQFMLCFDSGARGRPLLREANQMERLTRPGTSVAVKIPYSVSHKIFQQLHQRREHQALDPLTSVAFSHQTPPDVRRQLLEAREARAKAFWRMSETNVESIEAIQYWSLLVASICPASEVTLDIEAGSASQTSVRAGDWKSLEEVELKRRSFVMAGNSLIDLKDDNGELLGRLAFGMPGASGEAALTYGGVRCGKIDQLCGLAIARRPEDIRRQEGIATADANSWRRWARDVIATPCKLDRKQARILHAIDPESEIPIVAIREKMFTLRECEALAGQFNEIAVMFGELTLMAWDPIEWTGFGPRLSPTEFEPNSWLLPSLTNQVPKAIEKAVPAIPYRKVIADLLLRVWGNCTEIEHKDFAIGKVAGKPLYRECTVFSRAS